MAIKPVSGDIKAQPLNDNFSYLENLALTANGGPRETFSSESALKNKYPNGTNGAMLVTDANGANGYLYMWDGTAWKKGNLYQAQGIPSGSVDATKLAASAVTIDNTEFINTKNIFNKNDSRIKNGFIQGNTIHTHTDPYKISHPVLVEQGVLRLTKGRALGAQATQTLWLTDSQGNWQSTILGSEVAEGYMYFNVPEKSYVVFNLGLSIETFVATQGDYPADYEAFEPKLDSLIRIGADQIIATKREKWGVIGDSLTDQNNSTTTKRYYDYINDKNEYDLQILGVSGSGYARKWQDGQAFYQRVSQIDTDADFVTVFGSFNDLNYNAIGFELGSVDDVGTGTVCGCINEFFKSYFQKFPTTPILVILPTPWESNYIGNSNADAYVNALTEIATRYSAPILDLYRHSNLRPWDPQQKALCFDSAGVHPNDHGHQLISRPIGSAVRVF